MPDRNRKMAEEVERVVAAGKVLDVGRGGGGSGAEGWLGWDGVGFDGRQEPNRNASKRRFSTEPCR